MTTASNGASTQKSGVASIASPTDFSTALLLALGITPNSNNITIINAWQQQESNSNWQSGNIADFHNPLNAGTNYLPGVTSYCWNGSNIGAPIIGSSTGSTQSCTGSTTMAFATWQEGVDNTAAFIKANDPGIISALQEKGASNMISEFAAYIGHWNPNDPDYGTKVLGNIPTSSVFGKTSISTIGGEVDGWVPTSLSGDTETWTNPTTGQTVTGNPPVPSGSSSNTCLWQLSLGVTSWCIISKNAAIRLGLGALGVLLALIGLAFIGLEAIDTGPGRDIAKLATAAA